MKTIQCKLAAVVAVLLAAVLACDTPEEPAPRDILGTEVALYSSGNEEVVIRDFFQDRRDGFFLDIGCLTPVANNNTYYLEEQLDWSGIAVDALAAYEKAWKQARPESRFFAYAVTARSGEMVPFYTSQARPNKSSLDRGSVAIFERNPKEIRVPTITLNKLLDDNGVTKVDFVSIDINGSELPALEGFDLMRFKPDLIAVPAPRRDANRAKLHRYFTSRGYARLDHYSPHGSFNWFYAPRANRRDPSAGRAPGRSNHP